jgi:hypothetical protein
MTEPTEIVLDAEPGNLHAVREAQRGGAAEDGVSEACAA